jgi:hypothetical protein
MNPRQGLLIILIVLLFLFSGCFSPSSERGPESVLLPSPAPGQSPEPTSPDTIPAAAPVESPEEPEQVSSIPRDFSDFDSISIVVHNITVQRVRQGGKIIPIAFLDLSLRNNAMDKVYSLDYTSLVCIESEPGQQYPAFIPLKSDVLQEENIIQLLPCTLAPGQEKRGTVVFNLLENVESMALYIKEPDWTIVGEMYIPVIANGSQSSTWSEYTKNLEMVVHSAVLKDIQGLDLRQGRKSLVINVSITNHYPDDVIIPRETVFIITELARTFETGGDRVTKEIARQHLRFPLRIHSGETINGSILFSYGGTRTNKFVLTDRNYMINSIVDLNTLFRYE